MSRKPVPDRDAALTESNLKTTQPWLEFFKDADRRTPGVAYSATAPTNGQVYVYNSTTGLLEPSSSVTAKAWVKFTGSAINGAQTINASYNVSGVSRTGAGLYTVTFTTSFSSANYSAVLSGTAAAVLITQLGNGTQLAGSIGIVFSNTAGAQIDPVTGTFAAFGVQ